MTRLADQHDMSPTRQGRATPTG